MKKDKSVWWQPQGWLTFGSIVVVVLLVGYLVFVVGRYIAPRLRNIGKIYNSAGISRGVTWGAGPAASADGRRA